MRLEINQQLFEFPASDKNDYANVVTLEMLMQHLYPASTNGMAVAMQDAVVARSAWHATELHENDQLLILTASQGG